jgi:hypothetical protein
MMWLIDILKFILKVTLSLVSSLVFKALLQISNRVNEIRKQNENFLGTHLVNQGIITFKLFLCEVFFN